MNLWQIPFIGYGLIFLGIAVGVLVRDVWMLGALLIVLGVLILLQTYDHGGSES